MEKSVAEPAAFLPLPAVVVVVAVAAAVAVAAVAAAAVLLLLLLLLGAVTAETGGKTPLQRYGCDPTSILGECSFCLCKE